LAVQRALAWESDVDSWSAVHRRDVRGIISAIRQLGLVAASADIQRLAEDAVKRVDAHRNEDVEAWARQLAQDVADATD
jgi:hypothetical protein